MVESFTWTQGRQMASHTTNGVTWTYTYDANGLRTGRSDGTNTYQYFYAGDKLVRMIYNSTVVDIRYAGGQPFSMSYGNNTYYYVLNGQGDVIGLTNSSGKMVIGYTFGALWCRNRPGCRSRALLCAGADEPADLPRLRV